MPQDFPTSGSPPIIAKVLSLQEWLDYVANYDFGALKPSRVVLHHTWKPTIADWRGINSIRGMQKYYAGLGWSSGPHLYAAPDGIWLFTPMSQIGIHAGTGNSGRGWYSLGLEMVGNYDSVRPSGAVWEFSKAIMGAISKRVGVPPRQLISLHRDYTNQKSCPGWAITKDWVWGEVEAWVNNAAPPAPPPQGQIGTPTPNDEQLFEALINESYGKRAQGYNDDWAFHQHATHNSLGMPMGKSSPLPVEGKNYNYQAFARDTLFCEVPNWGDVQSLNDLLAGTIPTGGLGLAMLQATYRDCGATFHPEWAFHQYAVKNRMGPPIGESKTISVNNGQYSYQVFATDTLYNLVPNWGDIKLLSVLAGATDAPTVALREALLAETYKNAGFAYHPEWAFHQLARGYNIGAPLSNSYQVQLEQTNYALQVYALDTLYNAVPNWSDVRRLKSLASGQGMTSFALGMEAAQPEVTGAWEPPTEFAPLALRYSPSATAWSERDGKAVSMVILHGVAGAAETTLQRMTTYEARFSTHYYVTRTGTIYQLVDEDKAAWHAGFATVGGTWYNLNRTSIGIAIERPADWPEFADRIGDKQIFALRRLLKDLGARYHITPDGLILWSSLASNNDPDADGVPVGALREVLPQM